MRHWIQHPVRLVPLAFLSVILLGAALLMLPLARHDGGSAPFLVALFTATSAVSMTGLIVVDTAQYWSAFGQAIIIGLIQVGGFGVMSGATLLAMLVTNRLRLQARLVTQVEARSVKIGDVSVVLKFILALTLCVEGLAAVLLSLRLHWGYDEAWGTALWNGFFLSISAFNNAGFSTYTDSLVPFASDPLILTPIMLAITIGGLGFPVLHEWRRGAWRWRQWSLHSKITLMGSLLLVVGGMLMIFMYEHHNAATLGTFSMSDKWLAALFQSVSARTAGFNVVDIGHMHPATLAVHYVIMFIGGGSASTAGGIKVATFFILGFVVWAEVRGNRDANVFGRRISHATQRRALTVVLLAVLLLALSILALLSMTSLPLEVLMFEAISAFATVGLSTGITAQLPSAGQYILIVLMFVGRIGMITAAAALTLRSREKSYHYPEEYPIVG